MRKKKMCEYFNSWEKRNGGCYQFGRVCPKNTNSKCEIIPKKPRAVRVKAYAYIGAKTKEICVSTSEPFCISVPCVAVIKAKDVKELRK